MSRYFVFCFIVHCSTSKKWENTGCIRTHSSSDWSPTITSSIETRVVRRAARAPSSTATKVRRRMRTKRSIHHTATKTTARRILLVKATIRITQKRVHMATFTPRDGNPLYSFERSDFVRILSRGGIGSITGATCVQCCVGTSRTAELAKCYY